MPSGTGDYVGGSRRALIGPFSMRCVTAPSGPFTNCTSDPCVRSKNEVADSGSSSSVRAPTTARSRTDPSRASNKEILPDNLFTPGSRIDYFVKARYIPPDPRNPGGTNWYVTPAA